jgi:hypothetical protein
LPERGVQERIRQAAGGKVNRLRRGHRFYHPEVFAFVWKEPEDLHPDVFVPSPACLWLERYKPRPLRGAWRPADADQRI